MKPISIKHRIRGFTRWDLMIVLITIPLLIAVGFQDSPFGKHGCVYKQNCVNNLKQALLGFMLFGHDREVDLPWLVQTNKGGSLEFASTTQTFRHFQIASNEMQSPAILACP